jgi:Domain of unknown function (DUF1996)/PA14 domain
VNPAHRISTRSKILATAAAVVMVLGGAAGMTKAGKTSSRCATSRLSWKAEYFNDTNLATARVACLAEATPNHNWGFDAPTRGVRADNFSARWTRTVYFAGGTYQFDAGADDGVRLYVDGNMLIDSWKDSAYQVRTATVQISRGNHAVKMEFKDTGYHAISSLTWRNVAAAPTPTTAPAPPTTAPAPVTTAPPTTPAPTVPPTAPPTTPAPVVTAPLPTAPPTTQAPITGAANVAANIHRGTPPASSASEPSGNFRTVCGASHLSYDDPIVYPGQRGAAHLHTYFGNTAANANSTYNSLMTSGNSTCQGGPINRTAYWVPTLLTADNQAILPTIINVYYKGFGAGQGDTSYITDTVAPPPGLRMIAGFDMANPGKGRQGAYWYCSSNGGQLLGVIPDACPNQSDELIAVIEFPRCWNGQLDSPDHRSHLAKTAYNDYGQDLCPPTHPYKLPIITYKLHYAPSAQSGPISGWKLSSDSMPGMTHPDGESLHADWFGGWEPSVMNTLTNECIKQMRDCNNGTFSAAGDILNDPSPTTWHTGASKVVIPPAK